MEKLENAKYVKVEKGFNGKIPRTLFKLTKKGRSALAQHWETLDEIRQMTEKDSD